ncbi:unnamed protein product [Rhizophagus irregularis]|nr:unnamed protein product [Rhizophagus irregularis]CAB5368364.1 unnamed protein product [Rhizophagus irregularis]
MNEPGFKGDGLNEPDFKGVGLNTKPPFKDVGLDTNWTLRTPAWTIRREIRLLVLQGVSFLGFGTWVWNPVLLAMETEKLTNKPFATQLVKIINNPIPLPSNPSTLRDQTSPATNNIINNSNPDLPFQDHNHLTQNFNVRSIFTRNFDILGITETGYASPHQQKNIEKNTTSNNNNSFYNY